MCTGGGCETRPFGLSQQPTEAEGSLILEVQVRVASGPDNDGAGWNCQTARARLARRRGVTKVNQWLNPLKCGTGSKPGGSGPGSNARSPVTTRGTTPKPAVLTGEEAVGEGLRRTHGEVAAEKLGAHPVNRHTVNVGTAPGLPSPPPSQGGGGQVHRRRMAPGWGGGSVVVRGRESRLHGEGTQRVRNSDAGTPGGRR